MDEKALVVKTNRKYEYIYIIESLLFLLLCCFFTPRGDDVIFQFNEFFDFTNFNEYVHTVLYYGNGRILGNALCILFTRIPKAFYFIEFIMVHAFCFAAEKLINIKNSKLYFLTLFLLQPILMVKQIEAWLCGFINYFTPIFILVFILLILKKNVNEISKVKRMMDCILIVVLGLAEQLFIEHNAVMNFVIAVTVLVLFIYKKKNVLEPVLLIFSNLLGMIVIFGYRLYINYDETWISMYWPDFGRTLFSLSGISEVIKTVVISSGTFVYFYFSCVIIYTIFISVILTVDKKDKALKHKRLNVFLMLLYYPCTALIMIIYVTDKIEDMRFGFIAAVCFVLNIIGFGYSFIKAVFMKLSVKMKVFTAISLFYAVASYTPFLINGAFAAFRGCFFAYILIGFVTLFIADFARKEYGFAYEKQLMIFSICACIVSIIYTPAFVESRLAYNYKTEHYKSEYILPRCNNVFGDTDVFWEFAEGNIDHEFIPYKEFKKMKK